MKMDYRKPSKQKSSKDFFEEIRTQFQLQPYREEELEPNKLFLIICEGENTEPCYFEGFPLPTKTVLTKRGCNSKTSLVDYAITLKDQYKNREIWCVFDFDVKYDEEMTQPEDFNSAIDKAEAHGMKVAWSNDAFELWFVLHYQNIDNLLHRKVLNEILKDKWHLESFSNEAKTVEFCQGHYQRHNANSGSFQAHAIKQARRLHQAYGLRKDYAKHNPCTTVYLLVEELNKYIK